MATQKPGEKPHKPGEYREVGPRGGEVRDAREVTIKRGSTRFPPTQDSGRQWKRIGPPNP